MSAAHLVSVEIPKQARPTAKSRFDADLLEAAAASITSGETINMHGGEAFEKRTEAQVGGWYARQSLAGHMGVDPKTIRSRTFETEGGFSYGMFMRPTAPAAAAKDTKAKAKS
jgi:hypothetical protein